MRTGVLAVAAILLVVVGGYAFVPVGDFPGAVGGSTTIPTPTPASGSSEGARYSESIALEAAAAERGFNYTNDEAVRGFMSNAGVYAADYDDDGWTDLLAVGGHRPVLFENVGGTFRRSGALPPIEGTVRAALFFDYDNDGWQDLLLLPVEGRPIFLENDRGAFERREVGLDVRLNVSTGATAADYDGDGCLDVFIIQNGDWADRLPAGRGNRSLDPADDNGNPNYLFRGNCSGFTRVEGAGIRGAHWSLAASFVDLDGDGRPDIHVANDYGRDVLYWNLGNGTFDRVVLGPATDRNQMSSEVFDVNGDGRPDIFTTNIFFPEWVRYETPLAGPRARGNTLLLNRGNRTFADAADAYGLRLGGWGWAAAAIDLDNDGDRDVFQATSKFEVVRGLTRDATEKLLETYDSYAYPALFMRTNGSYVHATPGLVGVDPSGGRGVAALDFDRDGDVDVALATVKPRRYKLYENTLDRGNAIQVALAGDGAPILGARVAVTVGDGTTVAVVNARSDFLSQDSRLVHVGTRHAERVDVRVVWPDGTVRRFGNVSTGQRIVVSRSGIERRIPFDDG